VIRGRTLSQSVRPRSYILYLLALVGLLAAADHTRSLGVETRGLTRTVQIVNELVDALDALVAQNAELGGEDVHSKAYHVRDNVIPAMATLRSAVDRLEKVLPDDYWPLPTYRDMLFVK
jgi:glutamine synthetase